LAAFLIHPKGEFPLNDDWAYSAAVKSLLEGRGLKLSGWISTNIIAQVVWGALFCIPFGFSFTALRISTLTLGATGVLALYGLLREVDAGRDTALFGALLLAFNPLYLGLSYTFMPDVPFVAISVLSLYFLVRGMRRNTKVAVMGGLLLACVALLIRQNGLAIFIGCSLTYLARSGLRLRKVLLAGIPAALGGTVQILWRWWLEYKRVLPARYSMQAAWILAEPRSFVSWKAAEAFAAGLVMVLVYLGLFALPILLFLSRRKLSELFRSRLLTVATLVFAVFASFELSFRRMPLLPGILYDLGLGPATLRDAFLLNLPSLPKAGALFWFVITYLGFIGAVALVHSTLVAIAQGLKLLPPPQGKREPLLMLLASGLVYLVPVALLVLTGWTFDRYVLFLVPLGIAVAVLVVSEVPAGRAGFAAVPLAIASLALYAAFAIAGTHDYLAWNRVRWQALDELVTQQRVSAREIDGGFEFNGWYLYDSEYRITQEKSWWWVARDDFMVTFGPVPGFTELKRYQFRRWLPPGEGDILVLRRTAPSTLR
jgi:hypothetical protein